MSESYSRLDTRILVTYGHRRVRSCRVKQLKYNVAILRFITKMLSLSINPGLPGLVCDFGKRAKHTSFCFKTDKSSKYEVSEPYLFACLLKVKTKLHFPLASFISRSK
jgi:hypothetical protein